MLSLEFESFNITDEDFFSNLAFEKNVNFSLKEIFFSFLYFLIPLISSLIFSKLSITKLFDSLISGQFEIINESSESDLIFGPNFFSNKQQKVYNSQALFEEF